MESSRSRLAHGWVLNCESGVSAALIQQFISPAVRAVPSSMARRLGPCRVLLLSQMEAGVTSRWSTTANGLEVSVAVAGCEDHDVATELLVCLGQALWERLADAEVRAYWILLRHEIDSGTEGEIDEQALEEKRSLFVGRSHANSNQELEKYGRASFAGTAAEYAHCLWHDTSIRTGRDYLPAAALRRRLELLARWFPPNRGYRLFPGAAV
jgi:hypothetical protein